MQSTSKKIAFTGVFTALAAASGYALAVIPNVELVTTMVFTAGFLLGPAGGLTVGFLGEGLYSLWNPYGPAPLPLLAAQVAAMGVAGMAGGFAAKNRLDRKPYFPLRLGLAGFICTLLFDALTTLSFVLVNHFTAEQLAASVLLGTWFYAAHLAGNTILFAVLVPVLIRTVRGNIQIGGCDAFV